MKKIGINVDLGFPIERTEMLQHIKNAGFDAVFVSWKPDLDLDEVFQRARELGLEIPFVHAPFSKIEYLWEDDETGNWALQTQLDSVDVCAKHRVPCVVCHVYKGFGKEEKPTELGLSRIQKLLDYAEKKGVRVAFENTEGEGYLDAILNRFWNHPATGFCIDTGHEICYNYGHDLIAKYGEKLIATHLDDNLGISGESIFWLDDLHLLPWDGVVDFEGVAKRIQKTPFDGILMFELTEKSKPGRHENEKYPSMGYDAYLKEAHNRAVRFANLFE